MNKLIYGDTINLIKDIDDQSIDLLILDPNYQDWDRLINDGLINQAIRVCKLTGNIICFTKQPFDYNLRKVINPYFRHEIIWSFENGAGWVSNELPLLSFQKIFWLRKSNLNYINVRTGLEYNVNTKNFKRKNKVFADYNEDGKYFEKSEDGLWLRDHYHITKPHTGSLPSKPYELIKIFINAFCPENGTILDAFFGSGISSEIADELNRNIISFEIDESKINKYEK